MRSRDQLIIFWTNPRQQVSIIFKAKNNSEVPSAKLRKLILDLCIIRTYVILFKSITCTLALGIEIISCPHLSDKSYFLSLSTVTVQLCRVRQPEHRILCLVSFVQFSFLDETQFSWFVRVKWPPSRETITMIKDCHLWFCGRECIFVYIMRRHLEVCFFFCSGVSEPFPT